MEYGSCRSTKDTDEDRFFVMSCDGSLMESAKTLDEAQVKADAKDCAFVIKFLRLCGDADMDIISEFGSEDFDEEDF